jgi:hypothetical protein
MKNFTRVALVLVLTSAACSSGSSTSPITTAPSTTTVTLQGTVPAAVNGPSGLVQQSDFKNFSVGQGGGAVTITLTSAIETFPNGTLNPAVVMGLAVGSPGAGTCTLSTGATPTLVQPGATGLSGTLNAGSYCVQISDQTVQLGPVAYTVVIVAP